MFIGHFAVGFAAKRAAPRTSLGALIAAAQASDLLWPIFILLGVERARVDLGNTVVTPLAFEYYPYSHSLVGVLVLAALVGGGYWWWRRSRNGAIVLAILVLSHWVLDFISHRPDLALLPGFGPKVGLGLWNSFVGTIVVEGGLFVIGVALYARGTRARDRIGSIAWWALVAVLALFYVANLFGPPPPNIRAVAIAGLASWLFPFWGWWIDRHRTGRDGPAVATSEVTTP